MSDSATLVRPEPLPKLTREHLAAAGFLARYAYALDLRTFFGWCQTRGMKVFAMTRPHVELYVRWMEEERGYAPATTARRLSTVVGFYRFAAIDGYLDRSPAEYVRRPHLPEESQALGLDRMQLGALVATARTTGPDEAALVTPLGLLGCAFPKPAGSQISTGRTIWWFHTGACVERHLMPTGFFEARVISAQRSAPTGRHIHGTCPTGRSTHTAAVSQSKSRGAPSTSPTAHNSVTRSRRRLEGSSAISAHCSANLRTCPTAVDHFTPA